MEFDGTGVIMKGKCSFIEFISSDWTKFGHFPKFAMFPKQQLVKRQLCFISELYNVDF